MGRKSNEKVIATATVVIALGTVVQAMNAFNSFKPDGDIFDVIAIGVMGLMVVLAGMLAIKSFGDL